MNHQAPLPSVVVVEVTAPHMLRLTFNDGLVREMKFALEPRFAGGIMGALANPDYFALVSIEHRTIRWPNGVDLDPDVLHGDYEPASPSCFHVVAEYWLDQAS
jgi:Protein of unknown function (DUF2442)